jgi:hypothetical protein
VSFDRRRIGHAAGWSDVLRRARTLRRRRRQKLAVVAALAVTAALGTSFAANGGFGTSVRHSQDSPLTALSANLRDESGKQVGSIELELPGTVSLIPFRYRPAAGRGWEDAVLRPIRVLRTSEGPNWTTDSFKSRWFLSLPRAEVEGTSASLIRSGSGAAGEPIRVQLCSPCLPRDAGRLMLTLEQVSALVNEELSLTVTTTDGETARGALKRVRTPVLWKRGHGFIGGRLEWPRDEQ